jgi:hypothetical protein
VTILDKIKNFLSDVTDVSLAYNEINFIHPDNLDEEQIGYSFDSNGNSLIIGNDGDWQEEWLVIATDQLGDPIIVDISSPKLTVLSTAHGEGSWEPFVIANSLESFKAIISVLHKIAKNRTNQVDLVNHPITDKERKDALKKIEKENSDVELCFWENFFEND